MAFLDDGDFVREEEQKLLEFIKFFNFSQDQLDIGGMYTKTKREYVGGTNGVSIRRQRVFIIGSRFKGLSCGKNRGSSH